MTIRKIEVLDESEINFAKNILKAYGYSNITVVVEGGVTYVVGKKSVAVIDDENISHSSWRPAASLLKIVSQVNEIAPKRKKASDGTIGDQNHSATSDHQPKIKDGGQGIVTAADITHDPDRGCDCKSIASSLEKSRDERIKYVIWDRKIMSSEVSPWTWRNYTGSNPHDKHIHISVRPEKKFYDDPRDWDLSDLRKFGAMDGDFTTSKLAWGAHVDAAFKAKVINISAGLDIDPNELMAVIAFESARTFSPSVVNSVSKAVGLIQFMPTTAASLDTSSKELAAMSAVEQLDYVEKYLRSFNKKLRDIYDLYACVLWPKAIGKEKSYVLFSSGVNKSAYQNNKGLDANDDGVVTKAEAASKVIDHLEEGMRSSNLG